MPLLGKKIHHLVKPLTLINPKASVYVIKHTGECFQSKEYPFCWQSYLSLLGDNKDGRFRANKRNAEVTQPLDSLIDKAYIKINTTFFPGDQVQFKVKNCGRVIKGRVLTIEKEDENGMSPCSDKENSDNTDVNHNETTPRKYPLKLLPYKYNIRLFDEDKIISAVPAEDLTRCDRPPSKENLKLFIRSHALRHGTNSASPWIVDQKLVKKYLLPNKSMESPNKSPTKLTELIGSEKKRKASIDTEILRRKQLQFAQEEKKNTIGDNDQLNPKNQPVVKLQQLKMPEDKRKSPVKKPSKVERLTAKEAKNGTTDNQKKKSENTTSKTVSKDNLNGKKQKLKQATLLEFSMKKNKVKSPGKPKVTSLPLKKSPVKKSLLKVKKTSKKSEEAGKVSPNKNDKGKELLQPNSDKPPIKKAINPLKPSETVMYIEKVLAHLKERKQKNIAYMLDRLLVTLTKEEIGNLPELVQQRLKRRVAFRESRAKFDAMTKEEKEAFLKPIVAKYTPKPFVEDKKLDLRPLPEVELVPTPDGVPNELFGDLVMVVEFINSYSGLLLPNEPYPVQTDLLMKAVGSGNEGFGYLSRILLILLQTLLQDRIADDYKELGVRLSDLPINIHTTSELVRLCLRRHDETENLAGGETAEEVEDVPENVLSLLETSELYQLIPQHKLRILIGICHRIMNSYSVQEYMEQKHKNASQIWKDLLEQKKLISSSKEQWAKEEGQKPKEDGKDKEENITENNTPDPFARGTIKSDVQKEKSDLKVIPAPTEDDQSLIGSIKRRRQYALEEKKKLEEKRNEEKERRFKEQEKKAILSRKGELEKNYDAAYLASRTTLRQTPLGYDRNHTRYWLFTNGTVGLYLEKGWVSEHDDYTTYPQKPENPEVIDLSDSDDEPLSSLKDRETDKDLTFPVIGQNLWFHYKKMSDVEALMDSLHPKGLREGHLLKKLKKKQSEIARTFNLRRVSQLLLKPSDGDRELLEAFKKELTETEVRLRKGVLGGVPNLSQWEERLEKATGIQDLIPCLLETQANVLPRFFQGIMKVKYVNDEEGDCSKLQKWIENVEQCTTMSRLHVLLGVLDACILWEKSTENAKCKICRRKDEDRVLILCDNCNLAFHLLCLRPSLSHVPQGDWICPACQPTSVRQKDRIEKQQSRQTDEDQITVCEREPPTAERRLRSSTTATVQTRATRSTRREQMKKESSSEASEYEEDGDEEENESDSDSNQNSECCLCGGDEDVTQCCKCKFGYHTFCHVPPMHNKPRGNWWQKWKLSVSQEDDTKRMKPKRLLNGRDDDIQSEQQITTRLRQRINELTEDNPNGSKISSREARALRRALGPANSMNLVSDAIRPGSVQEHFCGPVSQVSLCFVFVVFKCWEM
uniref:Tyrosine-protein kinase BAZ1B n=1 Tax=Strigamia maritima TaxID=126957 RepID=T1J5N9_STRMM